MSVVGASPASLSPKPTITIFDPSGSNNQDLEGTADRLIQGATWKKHRTVLILPAASMVSSKAALSWWNMMTLPNQPLVKYLAEGMEVGDAYSQAVENVLTHPEFKDWEYVLTLESDNLPPADGFLKLVKRMDAHPELSCISGCYFTKGEGGVAQVWGEIADPNINFRPQPPRSGELVECYGTGMGFALWRIEMFKDERIQRPLFRTKASAEDGVGTQDLSFWMEARKWGYRCAVDCDVKVGHIDVEGKFGPKGFVW